MADMDDPGAVNLLESLRDYFADYGADCEPPETMTVLELARDLLGSLPEYKVPPRMEVFTLPTADERARTIAEARELGAEHARNAAAWVADGNTDTEQIRKVLAMLDAGDPEADDYLPRRPDLSGEWADDPTPLSLYRELMGDD